MSEMLPSVPMGGGPDDAVTEKMRTLISRWEAEGDRRCIFLDCYCTMTGNMLRAIDEDRFHDCEWVTRLLHRFAEYYFDALAAYEQAAAETPAVWTLTHDVARGREITALQHLLLGVNAHINYDLALALRDVLSREWDSLTPAERERRYEDHVLVNRVIAETVDTVQDEVVERYMPAMDVVDKVLGRLDEWITSRIIGDWRDDVWESARALLEAESAQAQAQIREELEARTLRLGHLFLLD